MKLYRNNSVLFKIFIMGVVTQIAAFLFDRTLGIIDPQDKFISLLLMFIDLYLLVPILLFLFGYYSFKKFSKDLVVENKAILIGSHILLAYIAFFNLFEIINQQALVFYFPNALSMLAPIAGSYIASKSVKKNKK